MSENVQSGSGPEISQPSAAVDPSVNDDDEEQFDGAGQGTPGGSQQGGQHHPSRQWINRWWRRPNEGLDERAPFLRGAGTQQGDKTLQACGPAERAKQDGQGRDDKSARERKKNLLVWETSMAMKQAKQQTKLAVTTAAAAATAVTAALAATAPDAADAAIHQLRAGDEVEKVAGMMARALGIARRAHNAAEQAARACEETARFRQNEPAAAADVVAHATRVDAARVTESATEELVRVLEATEKISKKTVKAAKSKRLNLAETGAVLVATCAKAAVEIATEASRLANTVAGPHVDEFYSGVHKVSGILLELDESLEREWKRKIKEAADDVRSATARTAEESTQQAAGGVEKAAQVAADIAKIFSVAADYKLVIKLESVGRLVADAAECLRRAAAATKELETTRAGKEATGADVSNAVNNATEATSEAARMFMEATNAALGHGYVSVVAVRAAVDVAKWNASTAESFAMDVSLPLTLHTVWKIIGFALLLFIVAVAFVVELVAYEKSQMDAKNKTGNLLANTTRGVCWPCVGLRCSFSGLAAVAILFLECCVLKSGNINKAYVIKGAQIFYNIPASIDASSKFCNLPSSLFVATFVLFAIPNYLSMIIEISCGAIELIYSEKDKEQQLLQEHGFLMIVLRSVILFFSVLQTRFFLKYYNKSIQINLTWSWILLSIIMAVNIGVWFTTVGIELQDITAADNVFPDNTFCRNSSISTFNNVLYPFQIEYCVMASLMAYTLISNLGRLAELLQKKGKSDSSDDSAKLIVDLMRGKKGKSSRHAELDTGSHVNDDHHSDASSDRAEKSIEFESFKRHSLLVLLGISFVVATLGTAVIVRFSDYSVSVSKLRLLFCSTLSVMHIVEFAVVISLFFYLKVDRSKWMTATHMVDRILLWLGIVAIMVDNVYKFWKRAGFINHFEMHEGLINETASRLEITADAFGIVQSVCQAISFEMILVSTFTVDNRLHRCIGRLQKSAQCKFKLKICHIFMNIICRCSCNGYEDIVNNQKGASEDKKCDIEHVKLKHIILKNSILNFLIVLNSAEWILSAVCFSFYFQREEDKTVVSLLLMPLYVFYRFHSAVCIHDFKKHLKVEKSKRTDSNRRSSTNTTANTCC